MPSRSSRAFPLLRSGIAGLMLCACVLPLLAACAGAQKTDVPGVDLAAKPTVSDEGDFDLMTPEQINMYQPDVRLSASFDRGMVRVKIRNLSDKEIGVQYFNFGLINPKAAREKKTIDATPGAEFPRVMLKPGEMASGLIEFRNQGDLAGCYIVFNHSLTRPSRAVIHSMKNNPVVEVQDQTISGENALASPGAKQFGKPNAAITAPAPLPGQKSAQTSKPAPGSVLLPAPTR